LNGANFCHISISLNNSGVQGEDGENGVGRPLEMILVSEFEGFISIKFEDRDRGR